MVGCQFGDILEFSVTDWTHNHWIFFQKVERSPVGLWVLEVARRPPREVIALRGRFLA